MVRKHSCGWIDCKAPTANPRVLGGFTGSVLPAYLCTQLATLPPQLPPPARGRGGLLPAPGLGCAGQTSRGRSGRCCHLCCRTIAADAQATPRPTTPIRPPPAAGGAPAGQATQARGVVQEHKDIALPGPGALLLDNTTQLPHGPIPAQIALESVDFHDNNAPGCYGKRKKVRCTAHVHDGSRLLGRYSQALARLGWAVVGGQSCTTLLGGTGSASVGGSLTRRGRARAQGVRLSQGEQIARRPVGVGRLLEGLHGVELPRAEAGRAEEGGVGAGGGAGAGVDVGEEGGGGGAEVQGGPAEGGGEGGGGEQPAGGAGT